MEDPQEGRAAKVPVVTVSKSYSYISRQVWKNPINRLNSPPFTFDTGILVTAVKDAVPFPTTYPVNVEFPVPPLILLNYSSAYCSVKVGFENVGYNV